ncbi:MAG: radical SAM protein [Bacteroidota bacterium]|nr:radical SAM protein [Bacteroidota bacterium]
MRYSKYNIFSGIKDSDNFFIVNILSGNADILSASEAKMVEELINGRPVQENFYTQLINKGYVVDEKTENIEYKNEYLNFIDSRDKDEVQLFFVPNYSCNFACSYCYQEGYTNPHSEVPAKLTDMFFQYVRTRFAGRNKYITLFGGEPLLNSPRQKELVSYFLENATRAELDVCIVTNGYYLGEYLDLLKKSRIREIQVTLDGTKAIHDSRRFLKGGGSTFDKIVKGIDLCLQNKISVNLRMVADKQNIDNLPELATFAIDKGWTNSPFFKTQIGRNYELHHCQSHPEQLFDRISLYEKIYELTKEHPHILKFYKPAYSVSKFLSENGNLPNPLFDACPACKTEWAFDYTGHIYPCTATVGKTDESLGTFYPREFHDLKKIKEWENRDVTSIPECQNCDLQLACGGGCGAVAKNRSGNICSPDCRPVKKLLELGFSNYF